MCVCHLPALQADGNRDPRSKIGHGLGQTTRLLSHKKKKKSKRKKKKDPAGHAGVKKLLKKLDQDGDGTIEPAELAAYLQTLAEETARAKQAADDAEKAAKADADAKADAKAKAKAEEEAAAAAAAGGGSLDEPSDGGAPPAESEGLFDEARRNDLSHVV